MLERLQLSSRPLFSFYVIVMQLFATGASPSDANFPAFYRLFWTITVPKPNYSTMPLVTLARLEQARDKTVAFILAAIEKAEIELGEAGTVEGEADGKPPASAHETRDESAKA